MSSTEESKEIGQSETVSATKQKWKFQ